MVFPETNEPNINVKYVFWNYYLWKCERAYFETNVQSYRCKIWEYEKSLPIFSFRRLQLFALLQFFKCQPSALDPKTELKISNAFVSNFLLSVSLSRTSTCMPVWARHIEDYNQPNQSTWNVACSTSSALPPFQFSKCLRHRQPSSHTKLGRFLN